MRSWIAVLLFTCLASAALADPQVNYSFHVFTVPSSDESMAFLSLIFGQVGSILPGHAGVFGVMFTKFNQSMLVLNTLLVMWLTIMGLVHTAGDGEFLGRNKMHAIWTPLRVCISVLLLIPSKTGYCILQIVLMWIVLQGIGAADTIWKAVLDYVSLQPIVPRNLAVDCAANPNNTFCTDEGNYFTSYTKFIQPLYENILALEYAKQTPVPGQLFLKSAVAPNVPCDMNGNPVIQNTPSPLLCYYFMYFYQAAVNPSPIPSVQLVAKMTFTNPAFTDPNNPASSKEQFQGRIVKDSLDQLIPVLQATAREAVSCQNSNILNCIVGKPFQVSADIVFSNEQAQLQQYFNSLTQQNANGYNNKYLDTANKYGWIFAGAFYRTLTNAVNTASMDVVNNVWTGGNHYASVIFDANLIKMAKAAYGFAYPDLSYPGGISVGGQPNLNALNNVSLDVNMPGNAGIPGASIFSSVVTFFVNDFATAFFNGNQSIGGGSITGDQDPLLQVQAMGTRLLHHCDWVFGTLFSAMLWMAIGSTILVSLLPGSGAVTQGLMQIMNSIINYILMYVGLVFAVSLLLAVYLPLIPYVIFTFAALGWMIIVIEAMLAAPLVALGVASNEGHEIYGRAQHAIMLVLAVFIRPTFMIFGLIAGMILSYVAVDFINAAFGFVVFDSLLTVGGGSGANTGPGAAALPNSVSIDPFQFIVYLIVYVALVVIAIQKSFELIHQIPDNILRWIGGQAAFSEYSGGQERVSSAAQQGTEQANRLRETTQKDAGKGVVAAGKTTNKAVGGGMMDD